MTPYEPGWLADADRTMVMLIVTGVISLLLWFVTILDVLKSEFRRDADKIVWFLFVTMLPIAGAIVYFILGPDQKVDAGPADARSARYRRTRRE
jgi:hypothetical protein